MHNIKIVIWDLDDTFWKGTLSEGEVSPINENHELVQYLTKKGIMNSICSKNDFEPAMRQLQKFGVWDWFIFPKINWEPKGQQIHQMLEDCSLRTENALFLDDNPMNLQEVLYYNPGINICDIRSEDTRALLWGLEGNSDPMLERLAQYKVLEAKVEQKKKFGSNLEFLRASNIKVKISYDCLNHVDRLLDLINRSNQLNYTKIRLEKDQLIELLNKSNYNNGYIEVFDNFGNYGIVGFFSVKDNIAEHLLFSCRTIGMGIEQYVYARLGFPQINIVGEVRSNLTLEDIPNWISECEVNEIDGVNEVNEENLVKSISHRILITGGCDLEQMGAYIKLESGKIDYRFNLGEIRHDHTNYMVESYLLDNDVKKLLIKQIPFVGDITFDKSLYKNKYDIVVISLLMDYTQACYLMKGSNNVYVQFGDYLHPITKSNHPDFFSDIQIDYFVNNFEFVGRISKERFVFNLNFIRNHIPSDIYLILINGCEIHINNDFEKDRDRDHHEMNLWVDEFVNNHSINTKLLDMREIVTDRSQLTDNIRHYTREIYYQLADKLNELINQIYMEKGENVNRAVIGDKIDWFVYKFKKKINKMIAKIRKNSNVTAREK